MRQEFFNFEINTNGQKLYEFTDQANDWIKKLSLIKSTVNLTLFLKKIVLIMVS